MADPLTCTVPIRTTKYIVHFPHILLILVSILYDVIEKMSLPGRMLPGGDISMIIFSLQRPAPSSPLRPLSSRRRVTVSNSVPAELRGNCQPQRQRTKKSEAQCPSNFNKGSIYRHLLKFVVMGTFCPNSSHMQAAVRRLVSIDRLPDEVLLMIFDRLSAFELVGSAARVSMRWAWLVRRRAARIHSRLQLKRLPKCVRTLIIVSSLQRQIPAVLVTTADLKLLRELCCHSGIRFSNDDIATIDLLSNLQHLDVFMASAARDISESAIANRLQSLVVNNYVTRLPGAKRCHLRGLHMYGEALFTPPSRLLALLHARRDHLTELTLRCAEFRGIVYEAIGNCPNLVVLQLYSCWLMNAEDFFRATRPLGLRRLHISGTVMVRKSCLSDLLGQLPVGLEELALSGSSLGDEHVNALATRLPHLRVFEAWRCHLTPEGVLRLVAALPKLEVLDLDMPLRATYVGALRRHPKLEFIRRLSERPPAERDLMRPYYLRRRPVVRAPPCRRCAGDPPREIIELPESLRAAQRHVRVECAAALFAENTFRWRGEGFRGKIFYHWMPARLLRPLSEPQLDLPFASTAYFNGI